ncbi:hypothetical protein M378DRAFT_164286 [Amanita muscaria Koide BX008]|uniref:Uncharacterized protein n=1 Tax=Amanita muscaria (strain Koide BX008) TaxID=946122 RepID=A0A0C2TAA5_AMAMK|nr:hypothetical protein M378DRAFT_164286 [Amanita muscaria Koide BX008]
MRFAIICLVSSLLAPALGSSLGPGIERHLPPLPSPYGTATSTHGNFVRYEGVSAVFS